MSTAAPKVSTEQLRESFQALGMTEREALAAVTVRPLASGGGRPAEAALIQAFQESGMSEAAAKVAAHGREVSLWG